MVKHPSRLVLAVLVSTAAILAAWVSPASALVSQYWSGHLAPNDYDLSIQRYWEGNQATSAIEYAVMRIWAQSSSGVRIYDLTEGRGGDYPLYQGYAWQVATNGCQNKSSGSRYMACKGHHH